MLIPKSKFVETIAPLIVAEGKKRGYKIFSTVIAQAVIESNYGQSKLSADYNNFFGLKCGSKWKGKSVNMKTKEEYTPGQVSSIRDNFRIFDSVEEGIKGYYDFVSTKRYANLKEADTPIQYAQFLKSDGYATSSSYVKTLASCVDKLGLDKYDTNVVLANQRKEVKTDNNIDYLVDEVIRGMWGNGANRRERLERAGYDYNAVQKAVNAKIHGGK